MQRAGADAQISGGREVVRALGGLGFGFEVIDALLDVLDLVRARLLGVVGGPERGELLVNGAELLAGGLEAIFGLLIGAELLVLGLALEGGDLDLELEALALELVNGLGLRVAIEADARSGLVKGVDGRVGQTASREVAVGELAGGDDGRVGDGDGVEELVTLAHFGRSSVRGAEHAIAETYVL
jgi:hypothetical protein